MKISHQTTINWNSFFGTVPSCTSSFKSLWTSQIHKVELGCKHLILIVINVVWWRLFIIIIANLHRETTFLTFYNQRGQHHGKKYSCIRCSVTLQTSILQTKSPSKKSIISDLMRLYNKHLMLWKVKKNISCALRIVLLILTLNPLRSRDLSVLKCYM